MLPDRDFVLGEGVCTNVSELTQDLELGVLFDAMAAGDGFLREIAKNALLASLVNPEAILYRQQILADCLVSPEVIREIYAIAVEGTETTKKVWSLMWERDASSTLHRSTEVLRLCVKPLRRLWRIANDLEPRVRSEGLKRFFAMIVAELDERYMRAVEEQLEQLEFNGGMLMRAGIGSGCKPDNFDRQKMSAVRRRWFERVQEWVDDLTGRSDPEFVYEVDERDESGCRMLGELKAQGIVHVAGALAQSADHILDFFTVLRRELGFYVGCLNLHDRLLQKQASMCFPEPLTLGGGELRCKALYDVCLSLSMHERTVGNSLNADDKPLVMITGANRGGKSTFLRSVGLAFLMMQCGMFVAAESFCASVCAGLFTHFKREEDPNMKSGKLDEELGRMRTIVGAIVPGSMVLLNESFASTNEREGSEIAEQIVRAFLKMDIRVFYVTHMFALAERFYRDGVSLALFLRAERLADGTRTFRLLEGGPLQTSFGQDIYQDIFEAVGDN
jgi:MutS domain V